MNPLQLMEMHRSDFTPNDLAIYQAILENPDQVVYKTTSRGLRCFAAGTLPLCQNAGL